MRTAWPAMLALLLTIAACQTNQAAVTAPTGCHATTPPSPSPVPKEAPQDYKLQVVPSQALEQAVTVQSKQVMFGVILTWGGPIDIQMTVTSPTGMTYNRTTADPSVNHHFQPGSESYAFATPAPGVWKFSFRGPDLTDIGETVYLELTFIAMASPSVVFHAVPDHGKAPLTVNMLSVVDAGLGARIVAISWDFGDCTQRSSDRNPTHLFERAGTYTVTLTATDSNSNQGAYSAKVIATS